MTGFGTPTFGTNFFNPTNKSNTGTNSGFNFGFGFGQQNQQDPEDDFILTEQMLVTNLPPKILDKFVSAYVSMKKVNNILKPKTEDTTQTTVTSDIGKNPIRYNWKMLEELESTQKLFESLEARTRKSIASNLTLLAHRIDSVKALYSDSKSGLVDSKRHFDESSHLRTLPSSFIKSFVTNIEKESARVSQALATYSSYMRPTAASPAPDYGFLVEQHRAVLRCSSRVEMLQQRLAAAQDELAARLKVDPRVFRQYERSAGEGCAQLVRLRYKQFAAAERKKAESRAEEADLFGNSTKARKEQPKQAGFGFGSPGFNFGKK